MQHLDGVSKQSPSPYYKAIDEFPPELWAKIFSHHIYNGDTQTGQFFAALSQVCQKWNTIARSRKFAFIRPLKKISRNLRFSPLPPPPPGTKREVLVSENMHVIFDKGISGVSADSITPISAQGPLTPLTPYKRVDKVALIAGHLLAVIGVDKLKIYDLDKGMERVVKQKLNAIITPESSLVCVASSSTDKFAFIQANTREVRMYGEKRGVSIVGPENSSVQGIFADDRFISLLARQTIKQGFLGKTTSCLRKKKRSRKIDTVCNYALESEKLQAKPFSLGKAEGKSIMADGSWLVVETDRGFVVTNRDDKKQKKFRIPYLSKKEISLNKSAQILQFILKDHLLVAVRGEKKKQVDLVTWNVCTGERLSTIPIDDFQQMDLKWNTVAVVKGGNLIEFWNVTSEVIQPEDGSEGDKHKIDELSLENLLHESSSLKKSIEDNSKQPEAILFAKFLENNMVSICTPAGIYNWKWSHKGLSS